MNWIKRAAQHGAAQGGAQFAALITGILIVRGLEKTEYAQYSLITALIPAVASLADSGIGAVLLSQGQAVRNDAKRLGVLLRSALRQRWMLAVPVIAISMVWLAILLVNAGTPSVLLFLLVVSTVLLLVPALTVGVLQVYHRIHLDVAVLRRAILIPSFFRLVATIALYATDHLSIWSLLTTTLLATAWNVYYLHRRASIVPKSGKVDLELRRDFRRAISKALPLTAASLITSQAVLGVILIKGSPHMLADFAAVSRFGLAFALFLPIIADIVAPSIARLSNLRKVLARTIGMAFIGCVLIVLAGATTVWLLRNVLLGLLGSDYANLEVSLVLVFLGYGVTFLGHSLSAIAQSRNWLSGSWSYVPLAMIWVAIVVLVPKLPTAESAALVFLSQSGLLVFAQLVRIAVGLKNSPKS